jgi:hypothetical protein
MANVVHNGYWFGTPATVTGFSGGTNYYVQVRAYYRSGSGTDVYAAYSPVVTALTRPSAPAAQGSLSSSSKPCVSWNAVTGATSYTVWRKGPNDGTTFYSKTTLASGTSWCDPDPDHGAGNYDYYVAAANSSGSSSSNTVTVNVPVQVPSAPASATAALEAGTKRNVVVSWTAPSSNGGSAVTSYLVTLRNADTNAVVSGPTTVAPQYGGLVFQSQKAGVNYVGEVTALNSAGSSAPRVTNTVRVVGDVPGVPTSIYASSNTGTSAITSWAAPAASDASAPVTSYYVRLVDVETGSEVVVFEGNVGMSTSRSFTNLKTGDRHILYVWALNEAGFSTNAYTDFRCLTQIQFTAVSGAGGSSTYNGTTRAGGTAAQVDGVMRVRSGQVLYFAVGSAGTNGTGSATNLGGKAGGSAATTYSYAGGQGAYYAGGGGGATVISPDANMSTYLVAVGGGGGASAQYPGGRAGFVGPIHTSILDAERGNPAGATVQQQGKGGGASAGAGGTPAGAGAAGAAGNANYGGNGGTCNIFTSAQCGGGGGGGYMGGGGGARDGGLGGAGGGASSRFLSQPGTYLETVSSGTANTTATGGNGSLSIVVNGTTILPTYAPGQVIRFVAP